MGNQKLESDFLKIVEEHKKLIFKVSYLYCINNIDKEDLFQEIIVNLWKAYPDFKGNSKLSTWIYRIAINTAVSWIRVSKKNNHVLYCDCMPNVIDDSESKEVYEKLQTVINHLNNIDKAIILLQLDGYSYDEIAEITGLTKTNVATKISRIKTKLKKDLSNT
ncbi:RNA polymerase sigma factor [Gaoshiqia sp. Z1-71]|uniref:RNA polymerase sigma factor n=1 Tax=Gaoshiqia hydrogeniformans TaxID=3290090 RepID=UPI003BF830E6